MLSALGGFQDDWFIDYIDLSLSMRIKRAGFSVMQAPDSPNNLSVAEESGIQLAQAEPDPAKPGTWWFWGAADNIRLPAWNAVKLAEKLAE